MTTPRKGIPLREGTRLLGLDKSGFLYYVRTGQIRVYQQAEGDNLYDEEDVKAIQEKRWEKLASRPKSRLFFTPPPPNRSASITPITVEDMPRVAPLIAELFGVHPNVERWQALITQNPEIGFMLVTTSGEVVGCGFLFPLQEEKILEILAQEVTPPTKPEEVLLYIPGEACCLYARTIGVTARYGVAQQHRWASLLIRAFLRKVVSLGTQGIIVKKIYGRSDTPEGERLMHKMGFTHLKTTTSHENFVIDTKISGLPVILRYEHAFQQWRRAHDL